MMYAEPCILARKRLEHYYAAAISGSWTEALWAARELIACADRLELEAWRQLREGASNADTPQA